MLKNTVKKRNPSIIILVSGILRDQQGIYLSIDEIQKKLTEKHGGTIHKDGIYRALHDLTEISPHISRQVFREGLKKVPTAKYTITFKK